MTPTRAEVVAALRLSYERGNRLIIANVGGTEYWFDHRHNLIKQADAKWNWTPAVFAPEQKEKAS